jgi:hypothetical protein
MLQSAFRWHLQASTPNELHAIDFCIKSEFLVSWGLAHSHAHARRLRYGMFKITWCNELPFGSIIGMERGFLLITFDVDDATAKASTEEVLLAPDYVPSRAGQSNARSRP